MNDNLNDEPLANTVKPNLDSPLEAKKISAPNNEEPKSDLSNPSNQDHKLKKFKNYFYEFLMLFLAVSLSFIAENYREHLVDKNTEKEYIVSLINDLNTDLVNIELVLQANNNAKLAGDSLFILLSNPRYKKRTNSIYFYARTFSSRSFFVMAEGTIKQLNFAGGLRLITQKNVIDSLQAYQNKYITILKHQELKEIQLTNYRDLLAKVFGVNIFESMVDGDKITRPVGNPKLFSQNKVLINELLMKAHFAKRNNAQIITRLKELKQMAIDLQKIMIKEYQLE